MRADRWQIISDDAVWMFPPDRTLSTVELSSQFYPDTPFESCIFYVNGDSNVLARYATKEEAEAGHEKLEKKYELKRCIK